MIKRILALALFSSLSAFPATAQTGIQRLVQDQITLNREGRERNLSVRVTTEQSGDPEHGPNPSLAPIEKPPPRSAVSRRIAIGSSLEPWRSRLVPCG